MDATTSVAHIDNLIKASTLQILAKESETSQEATYWTFPDCWGLYNEVENIAKEKILG